MLLRIFHRYASIASTTTRLTSFTYPQRIHRSPTAILESLNACVEIDGNNPAYIFIDDPFLIPTSINEKRQLTLYLTHKYKHTNFYSFLKIINSFFI